MISQNPVEFKIYVICDFAKIFYDITNSIFFSIIIYNELHKFESKSWIESSSVWICFYLKKDPKNKT